MPPKRTCKKKVRNGSKLVECGHTLPAQGDNCPNRPNHMLSMKTGKCFEGWCEGTTPKTASGAAAPTCDWIYVCPCKCHQDLWFMFEMSGMERLVVDKSGYTPPPRTFWLPSDDWGTPQDVSSTDEGASPTPALESPVAANVAPHRAHSYTETPTGRAARGQLEDWVKRCCDLWLIEQYPWPCTPTWISEEVGDTEGIKPPSVGAISAVFDRWVKLGFAVIEKKPTRFTRYTEEGLRLGLDAMKERAKRTKKRQRADLMRGVR